MYYTDPAQLLIAAGYVEDLEDLYDVDRDLPEV